jgi:hypothetical protein
MAWYTETAHKDHFAGDGRVKDDSDEDVWVAAVVQRILPSGGMIAKMRLEAQAREYFNKFKKNETSDTFAVWFDAKYGTSPIVQPSAPVVVKPKPLKPTAPPAVAAQDLPTFSAHAVKSEIEVGHPKLPKKRIRLRYHLLPNANATPQELEKAATKRTLKWVRRVYAQANLAPKILGIDTIAAVPENTLSVLGVKVPGYHRPLLPSGLTTAAAPSKITLELTDSHSTKETLEVPLTADASTKDIADAIKRVLTHAGYAVAGPTSHLSDASHYSSHDLVITKGGHPVKIVASHDDARFGQLDGKPVSAPVGQEVLEVPTLAKGMDDEDGLYGGTPRQRLVLRQGASHDDQIDIYVLEKGGLNGRAYPVYQEITDTKSPPAPYRNAAYVSYWSTSKEANGIVFDDQLEVSPFTLPHEIGHVLADTGHTEAEDDLMNGGWAKDDGVSANKRIYSKPLLVGSIHLKDEVPRGDQDVGAEMRTRGNKRILGDW